MARFRRAFYKLVPSWLSTGDGEKVLFTLGVIADAFVERMRQGLEARFPTRTGTSALALLGKDRGIARGRTESNEQYAARLVAWRFPRGHRVRGSAFALLDQIWHYWKFPCATIDRRGNYHERTGESRDTEAYEYGVAWDWDGAAITPRWGRFWVVLSPGATDGIEPSPVLGDPELWGGALGTPGYTLGQVGVNPGDVRAMRRLFTSREWYPKGTLPEWLIVVFSGDPFPEPDGTWDVWANRDPAYRYWRLKPNG